MAINPIALYAKPFDVVGAETRVLQNRIAREEAERQREADNYFTQNAQALAGGDQNAMAQAMAMDPRRAAGFAGLAEQRQAGSRQADEMKARQFVGTLKAITEMSPAERATNWPLILDQASQFGFDTSQWPQTYDAKADVWFRVQVAKLQAEYGDLGSVFKRFENQAPQLTGGMMWDRGQGTFVPIPGYVENQRDIALARRAGIGAGSAAPAQARAPYSPASPASRVAAPAQAAPAGAPDPTAGELAEDPAAVQVAGDETLYERAGDVAGPLNTLKELAQVPAGWFDIDVGEDASQAREAFRIASQNLIRSLSLSNRYPVAEQKRILENTAIAPKTWDNVRLLRGRMMEVDRFLAREIENNVSILNNPDTPKKSREQAFDAVEAMQAYRKLMGVPQAGMVEDGYQFLGGDPGKAENWRKVE